MISMSKLAIGFALTLMTATQVFTQVPPAPIVPNGCYWCIAANMTWDLKNNNCIANPQDPPPEDINTLFDCFNSSYNPDPSSIRTFDLTRSILDTSSRDFTVSFAAFLSLLMILLENNIEFSISKTMFILI